MEPLQQSLIKQTVFELGICAAGVLFARSSRLIHYFPSGSQKGLILVGGTLFASSPLYNLNRYSQERPFLQTVFEKGVFCASISLAASILAKRSFTVLPVGHTALLAAIFTVFATIFQKISSPALAIDQSVPSKILNDVILFPRQYNRDVIVLVINYLLAREGVLEVTEQRLPLLERALELNISLTKPEIPPWASDAGIKSLQAKQLILFPEQYSKGEITSALNSLKIDGILTIRKEHLPLINRALDLKVSLPLFQLDIDQNSFLPESKTQKCIIALFREYPLLQCCHDKLEGILKQANPPLPTLDELISNLSEQLIESMSRKVLMDWLYFIRMKTPKLSDEITQAFIQRMIKLNCPQFKILNKENTVDLNWITLTKDQLTSLKKNQAQWYFYLCSQEIPINYNETKFQDAKTEQLRKIITTLFAKNSIYQDFFPKKWAKKTNLKIDDETFNALAKQTNQILHSDLEDDDYESLFYTHAIRQFETQPYLLYKCNRNQLSDEDELFLRNTLPVFFCLTERYVSLLEQNTEELAKFKERHLAVIEKKTNSHAWDQSDQALKERVLKLVNDSKAVESLEKPVGDKRDSGGGRQKGNQLKIPKRSISHLGNQGTRFAF